MPDREKVIKALQSCSVQNDVGCQGCPYFEERKTYGHEWCTTSMAQDALALLKEQEDLGTELTNAVELSGGLMEISFEEVKQIFHDSIDNSANLNESLQNVANAIYQKGFNDGRPKYTHDLPLSDSACWNCNHCHDGGALSGWFCDIHGDLNKCNRLMYKCASWTERFEYQVDAKNVT